MKTIGRLGVVDDVAEHRRLLQRVGAVGDDDADPAARGVAGAAADLQLVVEGEVGARQVGDGLGLQPVVVGEARDAGEQALGVEVRRGPRLAGHRDRPAGGQDPYLADPRRWFPDGHAATIAARCARPAGVRIGRR